MQTKSNKACIGSRRDTLKSSKRSERNEREREKKTNIATTSEKQNLLWFVCVGLKETLGFQSKLNNARKSLTLVADCCFEIEIFSISKIENRKRVSFSHCRNVFLTQFLHYTKRLSTL